VKALLPGRINSASGTIKDGSVSWVVPLDGSQLDLATSALDDHGTAKIWGVVANVVLIALIVWVALTGLFIAWVARQRRRRAHRRRARTV
jgi:hypothetical protein